jgi:COPI associated protein
VTLSLINMGLAVMMGSLGVLTLINLSINWSGDLTEPFLGMYMVLFASILFLYELCWWQPFPKINKTFRRNFGFMYGIYSKGFFLIFIAFLTIGLIDGDNKSGIAGLDWATGIGWLFFGVFHIFTGFAWPDVVDAYKPPIAGLTTGSTTDNVV